MRSLLNTTRHRRIAAAGVLAGSLALAHLATKGWSMLKARADQRAAIALHCPRGMRGIPAGSFELSDEVDVELGAFCLDEREVTVAEYTRCVLANRCSSPENGEGSCNWGHSAPEEYPINCVDWKQAADYCSFAAKQLPSEAQWEYAARGGFREFEYPWGDQWPSHDNACWNSRNERRKESCKVGSFPPTTYGLHDMAGNVDEWVADRFASYPAKPPKNYVSSGGDGMRISRGGSWTVGDPMLLHSVIRFERQPNTRIENIGIRCASAPRP